MPSAPAAILMLIRLLPRVDRRSTVLLAAGGLSAALVPVVVSILTGRLVCSIPPATGGGFESAAGRTTLTILAGVTAFVVIQRVTGPVLQAVGTVLGRRVELHLQEQVIGTVIRPAQIEHLESPEVLNLLRVLRGFGTDGNQPALAVVALVEVLPSWFSRHARASGLPVTLNPPTSRWIRA